jgi:putative flavoprotein involved in K+ transport
MAGLTHEEKGSLLKLEHVPERVEVVVVGAGQAGLAMGYFLARQKRQFVIFEAGESVAAAWRVRWDSLKLFTPRRYNSLLGLDFPGEADGYPGRDEVVAYLEEYARRFELPVVVDSPVRSVTRSDDGFVMDVRDRTIVADQVVIATGPFQMPRVPEFADRLDGHVVQLHSTAYRRPTDIPAGTVAVVGGGNTGFRSPRSSLPPMRFIWQSAPARCGFRSGCSDATSSGG